MTDRPQPPGRPVRRPVSRAREGGSAQAAQPSRPPSFAPRGSTRRAPGGEDAVVVGPVAQAPARRPAPRPAPQPVAPPPGRPTADRAPRAPRPPRRRRRTGRWVALLLVVALLAWPIGLALWANDRIDHVEARSGAAATPGTTYLLAGSDSRADGYLENDQTEGHRTDTIMLLHAPSSGPAALISLPRDSYVEIPGHGSNKLNAAYSFGGAPLLVETVEGLTGITVDHYVEIGFGGVAGVVDAVGGVELCLDYVVSDPLSGLEWPEPGCREADGQTALSFVRMRYSDPYGDIGRAQRQQQLISALSSEVADPVALLDPRRQVGLARAGTDALVLSEGSSSVDLGRLALTFRRATGPDGVRGTPWLLSLDYRPGGVGSAVQLDTERNATLWRDLVAGDLPPGEVGGVPGR